ncbi:Uncharacterised protein [Staphylococcus aureus]|nr:Uncharacterised protein [Staphylococcus aureus]
MVCQNHVLELECKYLQLPLILRFFLRIEHRLLKLLMLNQRLQVHRHLGSHIRLISHELPFLLILIILHRQPCQLCLRILLMLVHQRYVIKECVHEFVALDRQQQILLRYRRPFEQHQ